MAILRPGQRVVFFPDWAVSGATIGFHGTVVRIHRDVALVDSDENDRSVYFVPRATCLSGDYVLRCLADILGCQTTLAGRWREPPEN